MTRLTKRVVDSARPSNKRFILWDGELPGFGLLILPSGRKTFILNFRTRSGRQRRQTIGRYGVLTVDQARHEALLSLAEIRGGHDPVASRQATKEAWTIDMLADRYTTDHMERYNSPSTQKEYKRLLVKHIRPKIGHFAVADIKREDIMAVHGRMYKTPRQANHILAILSKMFSLAELWGIREEGKNPARRIPKFPEKHRERFLSDIEIKRLGHTLVEAETIGLLFPSKPDASKENGSKEIGERRPPTPRVVCDALRLLLFTGARLSEILELKWEHVDFEAETIALPEQKGGIRRPHPIGSAAIKILQDLPHEPICSFVLPKPNDPTNHLSPAILEYQWGRIRRAAEINDVRIHDFRHTVGTYASQAGNNAFLISHALRHKTLAMTLRYVNPDAGPIRKAFDQVGERIGKSLVN